MKDMASVAELIRIGDLLEGPPNPNPLKIRERPNGGLLWGQFELQTPPANVLVDGFLCCGDFAMVQGEPGSGKSMMMMDLAIAVAHGRPFLGRYAARRGNVLIIEEEGQGFDLVQRGKILGARPDSDIVVYHCRGFQVDSAEWLKDLEENLLPLDEYALILIDPLSNVHSGNEDKAVDMKVVTEFYKKVRAVSPMTTVVFLHHVNKAGYGAGKASLQHGRGTSALAGSADVILETIKQGSPDPALIKLQLHMPKRRAFAQMGSALNIELDLRQPGEETWKIGQAEIKESEEEESPENGEIRGGTQEEIRARILKLAPQEKFTSANGAFDRIGGHRAKFLAAWRYLLDNGLLKKVGKFFVVDQASEHVAEQAIKH